MTPPEAAQAAVNRRLDRRQRTLSLFNFKVPESASRSRRVVVLLLAVIAVAVFGAWMLVGRTGGA